MKRQSSKKNLKIFDFFYTNTPLTPNSQISKNNFRSNLIKNDLIPPIKNLKKEFSFENSKSKSDKERELFNCISQFNSNKKEEKIQEFQFMEHSTKKEKLIFHNIFKNDKIKKISKLKLSSKKKKKNKFMNENEKMIFYKNNFKKKFSFENFKNLDRENIDFENDIIDFKMFIKKNHSNKSFEKSFICEHCNKRFTQPSALGGHTAKNHPNSSSEYKKRKNIILERKIETKRKEFYRKV